MVTETEETTQVAGLAVQLAYIMEEIAGDVSPDILVRMEVLTHKIARVEGAGKGVVGWIAKQKSKRSETGELEGLSFLCLVRNYGS